MEKKTYKRPELTVVEFKSEKGYASSGILDMIFGSDDDGIESYGTRSGWGSGDGNGFFSNDASAGMESYGSRSGWGNDSDNGFF